MTDPTAHFYQSYLPEGEIKDSVLTAPCPFCLKRGREEQGKIVVFLTPRSFFKGYFRCQSFCVEGGFASWFARLMGIDQNQVPGGNPDEMDYKNISYPEKKINSDIDSFQVKLEGEAETYFKKAAVSSLALKQLRVGYNGRYLVYPYYQHDSNVYSARCVHPEEKDDFFWYGDEQFKGGPSALFNVEEISRCRGGSLFLCEGEENLCVVKSLGFPGVAIDDVSSFEKLDVTQFKFLKTLFVVTHNTPDSYNAARYFASKVGYKVRILIWEQDKAKDSALYDFALEKGKGISEVFSKMVMTSRPFSPFSSPERECKHFYNNLAEEADDQFQSMMSGFPRLDSRLKGIHGINILGGGPKVGKSCFMIQIATEMALREIPVLYYDFENGRQRIYHRTMSRLCRLEADRLRSGELSSEEEKKYKKKQEQFQKMLRYFRVINDRKVTPELMRQHIDFLKHETQHEYPLVVIDSLHKLPFKNMSQKRSGIDAWLRQMEAIRDSLQVSFLVISELSRDADGGYEGQPHMGAFKGSGDIEYSADNAMVLLSKWDHMEEDMSKRVNELWLVGSRERSPGLVGHYMLDYPYWGFVEQD